MAEMGRRSVERGEPGERDQNEEDLLGRVGRRGDRVRGEHRQRGRSAEALVLFLRCRQRFADDESLDQPHGFTPVGTSALRMQRAT